MEFDGDIWEDFSRIVPNFYKLIGVRYKTNLNFSNICSFLTFFIKISYFSKNNTKIETNQYWKITRWQQRVRLLKFSKFRLKKHKIITNNTFSFNSYKTLHVSRAIFQFIHFVDIFEISPILFVFWNYIFLNIFQNLKWLFAY